jgi:D-alanine-D-alanine ligase
MRSLRTSKLLATTPILATVFGSPLARKGVLEFGPRGGGPVAQGSHRAATTNGVVPDSAEADGVSNQRIGVIQGGPSPAGDQSLRAGERVAEALSQRGYDVTRLVARPGLQMLAELGASPIDVAFVTLPHGAARQSVLGALELLGVPHTGSGALANALSRDLLKSKELFRLHNLPTCPHYLADDAEPGALSEVHGSFGYPVRVSPRHKRAELGAESASDFQALSAAVTLALSADEQVVVERAVEGVVVEAALLNGRMLGALQRRDDGWHAPELDATRVLGILNLAERAARVLECRGAVTVSTLVTRGGNEYILEVDAAPSLAQDSLLTELAVRAGFAFGELCETLLRSASGVRGRIGSAPAGAVRSTAPAASSASAALADRSLVETGPAPMRVAV